MVIGVDTRALPRFIVRIDDEQGRVLGTGFFVAAEWMLTCAHVVGSAEHVVVVPSASIAGHIKAKVAARSAAPPAGRRGIWPFPDLALLHAPGIGHHPCVVLQAADPIRGVTCHTWGFSEREQGIEPIGSPATFQFEGVEGDGYLKLAKGQAMFGLSGAPLICPGRGTVVGVVAATMDPYSDRGGWASPVSALLTGGPGVPSELAAFGEQIRLGNRAAALAAPIDWSAVFDVDQPGDSGAEWLASLRKAGMYLWTSDDVRAGWAFERDDNGTEPIVEAGETVDVTLLRRNRLPGLQQRFQVLGAFFDQWLTAGRQKRVDNALRILWLVGTPGPYRSMGLLTCLARAGMSGRAVYDAGRELHLATLAIERPNGLAMPPAVPVVGIDLEGNLAALAWHDVRKTINGVRKRSSSDDDPFPVLLIAGTSEQEQEAYDTLQGLIEITPVDVKGLPHQRPYSDAGSHEMVSASLSHEHVFNRGLPMTTRKLFGRDTELDALRHAWASDNTRIISVVAYGGTGKSALVNTWLREMRDNDYRGAQKVLAWSFYSQGTKANLVSADLFVSFALTWLGDESAAQTLNPWAKGLRLAELIKKYNILLVLDGVEPLQYPLSAPDVGGQLTDDSIRALLEQLAKPDWHGLCVITTRVPLTDLERFEMNDNQPTGTAVTWKLENLDDQAGASLLQHLTEKKSSFRELQQAVQEVEGHALAITLLGNYLRDVHQGDLAGRFDVERLTIAASEGGHARRIMDAYVSWLEQYRRFAELAVLDVIGLFDRPAPPEAMAALVDAGALGPVTAELEQVGSDAWNRCVDALRKMGLLNHQFPASPGTLDAHPLVREHFRDKLRLDSDAWTVGNRTLYDYYRTQTPQLPDDSQEMNVLYASVTHGCAAGRYQDVFDNVLLTRVWRDRRTIFSTRRLGMTGSDLVALSNYFRHRRWTDLRDVPLTDRARTLIMTNAGVRLRQLGRLSDARECFGAVVRQIDPATAGPEEMEDVSYAAAQYCELLVIAGRLTSSTVGETDAALASGQSAVEYADRGGDPYFSMHARSSLAEVHFMLGELEQADALFEEAKSIDRDRHPHPPFLYSQSLFRYGYYLIESGRAQEILDEGAGDLAWGTNGEDTSLLSSAIRLLILGAARRSLVEQGSRDPALLAQAQRTLDDAVTMFRTAGYADYTVRGLIERASFYRARHRSDDYAKAQEDLERATFEAHRGRMKLLSTDILLQKVACYLAFRRTMTNPERSEARDQISGMLDEATRLIDEMGYFRRRELLATMKDDFR